MKDFIHPNPFPPYNLLVYTYPLSEAIRVGPYNAADAVFIFWRLCSFKMGAKLTMKAVGMNSYDEEVLLYDVDRSYLCTHAATEAMTYRQPYQRCVPNFRNVSEFLTEDDAPYEGGIMLEGPFFAQKYPDSVDFKDMYFYYAIHIQAGFPPIEISSIYHDPNDVDDPYITVAEKSGYFYKTEFNAHLNISRNMSVESPRLSVSYSGSFSSEFVFY